MTLVTPTDPVPTVRVTPAAWSTAARTAVALILLVSIVARLPHMNGPPLGPHSFRQTQTAIGVQAWLDRGFTFFHYETPVFGPPWQAPFEAPIYQTSAFALAKLGVPTDLALRIAAVLWFHASALLLLVLARRYLGEAATVAALAVYTLSPFALQWGRAILIDYASVTFTLGYLLATLSWAERPRRGVAALAVVLGALAAATKLTTIPVVVPALLVVAYLALARARREGTLAATLATLGVLAAVPLAVAVAWTRWADAIKGASPATRWITSKALTGWNFGSAEQRADWQYWGAILVRIKWITPGLFVLALLPAIGVITHGRGKLRLIAALALAGLLLPIAIFFNLYWVHDYYLIAITPCLALLFGIGVGELVALRFRGRAAALAVATGVAVLTALGPASYARTAWANYRKDPVVALSAVVTRVTPPDGWVVIEGDDWSPRIPYLSHRRAFMTMPRLDVAPVDLVADRPEIATLVCAQCAPELLDHWPSRERVTAEGGFTVYRVHPAAAQARRLDSPTTIP